VRQKAVARLASYSIERDNVVNILLKLFKQDQNHLVRKEAALSLGKLKTQNPLVVQTLVETIFSDEINDLKGAASLALGNIGYVTEDLIENLLNVICDPVQGTNLVKDYSNALGIGRTRLRDLKNLEKIKDTIAKLVSDGNKKEIVKESYHYWRFRSRKNFINDSFRVQQIQYAIQSNNWL